MSYIIRIDDRLVHGQIVEGWIKPLNIEVIVICSDHIYSNSLEKVLFEMSVPAHVKLDFSSIFLTAQKIANKNYDRNNVLILLSSLEDLYKLVLETKKNLPDYIFPPVNIGGIRYCKDRKQLYKALCLNKEDLEIIKKLNDNNIILEYYLLPQDNKIVLNNIIEEIEKNI